MKVAPKANNGQKKHEEIPLSWKRLASLYQSEETKVTDYKQFSGFQFSCMSWYRHMLRAGRYGDRIPVGARFSALVRTGLGAHPASYTMGTGSFKE
jgi:hypothetical protein